MRRKVLTILAWTPICVGLGGVGIAVVAVFIAEPLALIPVVFATWCGWGIHYLVGHTR